jgi:hypothetical protein
MSYCLRGRTSKPNQATCELVAISFSLAIVPLLRSLKEPMQLAQRQWLSLQHFPLRRQKRDGECGSGAAAGDRQRATRTYFTYLALFLPAEIVMART